MILSKCRSHFCDMLRQISCKFLEYKVLDIALRAKLCNKFKMRSMSKCIRQVKFLDSFAPREKLQYLAFQISNLQSLDLK